MTLHEAKFQPLLKLADEENRSQLEDSQLAPHGNTLTHSMMTHGLKESFLIYPNLKR